MLEALDSGARRAPEEDDDAEEVGEGEAEARRFRKSFWLKARGLARCWFAKGWAESPADDEPASDWSDEVDEDDLRRAEEPPRPKDYMARLSERSRRELRADSALLSFCAAACRSMTGPALHRRTGC